MRAPPLVLLMALARQVTHFLVHHQVHQLQSGLPQQVSYSLLQQTDDVGHRKDHLHVGILFGGEPAELLHGSLLFDLISFLHSDSLLFSWQKNNRRPIMAASLRVAYFLRIYGQSLQGFGVAVNAVRRMITIEYDTLFHTPILTDVLTRRRGNIDVSN